MPGLTPWGRQAEACVATRPLAGAVDANDERGYRRRGGWRTQCGLNRQVGGCEVADAHETPFSRRRYAIRCPGALARARYRESRAAIARSPTNQNVLAETKPGEAFLEVARAARGRSIGSAWIPRSREQVELTVGAAGQAVCDGLN